MTRRAFRHEGEEVRRQELVTATLDCIAEAGIMGATVRDIAERAGVTPGLIRHYFVSKDLLVQEAYREVVRTMWAIAIDAAAASQENPLLRLRTFVLANFRPPALDQRMLSLWATFISQTGVDPHFAAIHREGYLLFREQLEKLLSAAMEFSGRPISTAECRRLAIAVNGIIDGLWLEGCVAADLFADTELGQIAETSVEALIGLRFQSKTETPGHAGPVAKEP
jgi:AcrR family transcriptional regulator